MGFSRQEYWTGLPFPSPEDLPNPGIKPGSPTLQADTLPSEPSGKPFSEVKGNPEGPTDKVYLMAALLAFWTNLSLILGLASISL